MMENFQNKPTLSSLKHEFKVRQPIRPFISSTFTDFQIERDFLLKNIFPQLDAQCQAHGSCFSPVGLRWAVTKEQANSGNVIKLCLDYVNHCMPFFICLLGERYGSHRSPEESQLPKTSKELHKDASWLDKNFMNAAENGFQWVLQESFQNSSITELEVIQAAFLNDSPHVRFYFREVVSLDDLFSELDDSWKDEKLKLFKSESKYAELKVSDLKKRITNKGLQVKFFRTPEQLGELILNDWTSIIKECYPPVTKLLNEYGREFYNDWCAHQTFAQARINNYVTTPVTEDLFDVLDNHAARVLDNHYEESTDAPVNITSQREDDCGSVVVLVGKRGCGKTALLANWIKHFQMNHPGIMVLSHFVGSSAQSLDMACFMRRATFELRENYSSDESEELTRYDTNIMDFNSICEAFLASLMMGPSVLVLDGIHELGASYSVSAQQVKEMTWLPSPLPKHCKIIISTVKSDLTYKTLIARPDSVVHQLPLVTDASTKTTILKSHFRNLNDRQTQQIMRCSMSDRPMFLTIVANELHVLESHKLDKMLTHYCICTNFRELWRSIIERWCKEYGWQREGFRSYVSVSSTGSNMTGWVADLLCLVATSRHGLSESEILGSLKLLGYYNQTEVTHLDFARFRLAAQYCLIENPEGLIMFFHNQLKETVEHCLLGLFGTGASDNMIGSSSALMQSAHHRHKRFYSEILAKYFWEVDHSMRRIFELPWQLDKIGDMQSLCNFLSQPEVFLSMYGSKEGAMKIELMQYWKVLNIHHDPYDPAECYKNMVTMAMKNVEFIQNDDILNDGFEAIKMKISEFNLNDENRTQDVNFESQDEFSFELQDEVNLKTQDEVNLETQDEVNLETQDEVNLETQDEVNLETQDEVNLDTQNEVNLKPGLENSTESQAESINSESEGSLNESEYDEKPRDEIYIAKLAMNAGKFLREFDKVECSLDILTIAHQQLVKSYPVTTAEQYLLVNVKEALGDWYQREANPTKAGEFYRAALATINEIQDENARHQIDECKGRLMTHLGRREATDGNFAEANKLLKGAVDFLKHAKSTVGLATAYFNMGMLRAKQQRYQSAETCFRDSIKMRETWYGKSHVVVAEPLHELASILSQEHYKNCDKLQAEALYRRALSIRETCLSKDHQLVATTLFELGKLLRSIGTYQSKTEAAQVLLRSLDIQTASLGSNHRISKAVRSSLKGLEKELQQGDYTDATSKQPDRRSRRQPFSSLSWHDQDLLVFERQLKEKEKLVIKKKNTRGDLKDQASYYSKHGSEKSFLQSSSPRPNAADGVGHNPCSAKEALQRSRSKTGIISNYSGLQYRSDTPIKRELNGSRSSEYVTERFSFSAPMGRRTKHTLSNVTIERPYSSISQISHWSRCDIPSKFSVDVSNALTVHGPHSQLDALLGDPPCPRLHSKPKYKSSWYHIPGRYPKHLLDYPSKRHQSRPNKRSLLDKICGANYESFSTPVSMH